MNSNSVILVDDHQMFREGLRFLLSKSRQVEVIAEAENGEHFLELLEAHQPDLVLMDINMPKMNGIEATQRALAIHPDLKVIALSMFGDEVYYYNMIHAGVKGFVLKKAGSHDLESAIEAVLNGNDYFSQELLKNVIISLGDSKKIKTNQGQNSLQLSEREQEVLQQICNGLSTKEIAEELNISPRTVEGHKTKLMDKTAAKNTSNLIMIAIKNKLIEI
ncbi:response regulator transcription factor [Rapidithrix thailandica]|uniref:Response regulator transcription factor n=1 Tax=Rapidithrix thailandica TaxID=413964 RepID=A0AAW9S0Q8_9BACT